MSEALPPETPRPAIKDSPQAKSSSGQLPELVTVVITCYNHGRFLGEAIESVLSQSYQSFEVIVVDDGSTDDTREVAARYPQVRCISQPNQGLSAARNRGIQEGRGEFFVFLDADDRLLPPALEAGVKALSERPECALAFGDYRAITSDGTVFLESTAASVQTDYYAALLRTNCIEMHATVIYRRAVFQSIGTFDTSLKACEDYDLYLRVSRKLPICHYAVQVAEYRQHDSNMSGDPAVMLTNLLSVIRSQKKYVKHDRSYRRAYRAGLRSFAGSYAAQLAQLGWNQFGTSNRRAFLSFLLLARCYPLGSLRLLALMCLHRVPGISIVRSKLDLTRSRDSVEDAR